MEAEQRERSEAVNGGQPVDPDAPQDPAGDPVEPSDPQDPWGYRKGDLADLDMSPEQMQAYARAQGDPEGGVFTIEQALADLPGEGELWVDMKTDAGLISCRLYEEQTPITVANFVGLARGLRPALDVDQENWVARPYYDGVNFHRAIPGFVIQGGDPTGTGRGRTGYVIQDEFVEGLVHDEAGMLSMANRGLGTGGGQFFVTLAPVPHLDGKHTIFGKCEEAGIQVAEKIAATSGGGATPRVIEHMDIVRR